MSLTKRIISCALALSVALGGICATATEPRTEGQKSGNRPLTTREKQIIGGASTVGGVGLLAILGFAVRQFGTNNHRTNKLSVLIIGQKRHECTMSALSGALKNDNQKKVVINATYLSNINTHLLTKEEEENSNWNIKQCCIDDDNLERLVKQSKVVIAMVTNQDDITNINDKIKTIAAKDKVVITAISSQINSMQRYSMNWPDTTCVIKRSPQQEVGYRMFGFACVKYDELPDGSLQFQQD